MIQLSIQINRIYVASIKVLGDDEINKIIVDLGQGKLNIKLESSKDSNINFKFYSKCRDYDDSIF